jgi:hypothetical protein
MKSLHLLLLCIALTAATVCAQAGKRAGDLQTDAALRTMPDFHLSSSEEAAGIDGKMQIGVAISADGKTSDIRIYGGPMWPCGTNPQGELEKVRKEVKQLIVSSTFEPATKNGKPRSSDVQLTFVLSDLFRNAAKTTEIEENLKKGINPPLVEVRDLSRFALSVPVQLMGTRQSPGARFAEIQVLIDENGNVISAGGFRTGATELTEARGLACTAKFKPLVLNNKPVKMWGIIVYGLY